MIIRIRSEKKPGCRCPEPPYLHIKIGLKKPFVTKYYDGPLCMCDIFSLLEEIDEQTQDEKILNRVRNHNDIYSIQAARIAHEIDQDMLKRLQKHI